MANKHFGNIGDIWKHLPLTSILEREKPIRYWESHSGSARYDWEDSEGRNYGAGHFYTKGRENSLLRASKFYSMLESLSGDDGQLTAYPGSPEVAMNILGPEIHEYRFCDLDGGSLDSIQARGRALGISPDNILCHQEDGLDVMVQALDELPASKRHSTLLVIDPYQPLATSARGIHSWNLFWKAVQNGVKTVLWYGYSTGAERDELWREFQALQPSHAHYNWIAMELELVDMEGKDRTFHPGVMGCGLVFGHLQRSTLEEVFDQGKSLIEIYRDTQLPDGTSGALTWGKLYHWDYMSLDSIR